MSENFAELETGQIELLHQQSHDSVANGDCLSIRHQHDSLAAELNKRGVLHDTAIVCPEPATDAPNYERGFTDDICIHCAFGQLYPHCNLYDFEYLKYYKCDSFRYYEVLELEPPHGFLMTNGKQTALASIETRDITKPALVISNGEAFGIAEFEQPAQVGIKEFDSDEWQSQHRITQRERRQWWPDEKSFYIYRLKNWWPYEGVTLYEDGRVINEPKLSSRQWKIVSKSKELPKQIILDNAAVAITDRQEFIIHDGAGCDQLEDVLAATYETEIKAAELADEIIPIYSLALVRNPRMRVSKKNIIAEIKTQKTEQVKAKLGTTSIRPEFPINYDEIYDKMYDKKQEDENMPFGIVERDGEYCVINTDTEESMGCHDTEAEAEAQLVALRINVEEGESAVHDKPKKKPRHPKKKEILDQPNFLQRLKLAAKNIIDIVSLAEAGEPESKLFMDDVGIGQKLVNGELWHFTWSTNAFKDRDGEIFSTKSLENYVATNEAKENKGFFNFWHINEEDGNFNTDFAEKQWQGVVGRILIEAGPYLKDEKGRAAKKFYKKYPNGHPDIAPEGWGCSPEYKFLPEERMTGIYENIWITKTSTLPKMAAANIWTDTRQANMRGINTMALTDQQHKGAIIKFGEEFVARMIEDALKRTAELEEAGVANKSAGEPETETTQDTPVESEEDQPDQPAQVTMSQDQFDTLAEAVAGHFQVNNEAVIGAMGTIADNLREMENRVVELESKGKAKEKAEMPTYTFELQRASEDKQTAVTDDDDLKNQKPAEIKGAAQSQATITPDSFFTKT